MKEEKVSLPSTEEAAVVTFVVVVLFATRATTIVAISLLHKTHEKNCQKSTMNSRMAMSHISYRNTVSYFLQKTGSYFIPAGL